LGSTSEAKDNRISAAALEDDIRYCLGILKINKPNDEIETKIEELSYTQNIIFFSTYQKRLIALKIIADSIVPAYNTLT
jgi:hypothetical protein